ncbi:hypothetical protein [Micromonospora psammae]|uniref:hypothetical protein n=1 Tax=Micromonospora sp. CPCC 205556 TaxID=3122398 RepID=UPI002FF1A768
MLSGERRLLAAMVEVDRGDEQPITVEDLARVADLDVDATQRALQALASYGDVFFRSVLEPDGQRIAIVTHVTASARRAACCDSAFAQDDVGVPVVPPQRRRRTGRALRVIGALLAAAAAKAVATVVIDEVQRP